MQSELELDLLGAQAAHAEGMVFVDELDSDDGCRGFGRDCLADAVRVRVLVLVRVTRGKATGRGVRCICARADGL